ncbi:MAG: hypothetical protein ACI9FB_002832 [Candidatus Azotimanducaceae bacterium]
MSEENEEYISHICISDLHLGAGYNLLTNIVNYKEKVLDSNGKDLPVGSVIGERSIGNSAETNRANPVLREFSACLTEYLRQCKTADLLDTNNPPKLVLMGDVLELGLASHHDCAVAFRIFIRELFKGKEKLLSKEILFIPGNHDHHLWVIRRDQEFVNDLTSKTHEELPFLESITTMFEPENSGELESEYLTKLIGSAEPADNKRPISVKVKYPNFALRNDDWSKSVILHHGHYTDPQYSMVTSLAEFLFDQDPRTLRVGELQTQNSGWVDFFWSSLGNQATPGKLYEIMQDSAASHKFILELSDKIMDKYAQLIPAVGLGGLNIQTESIVTALLDATIGSAAEGERNSYSGILSENAIQGLIWYLNDMVSRQWREEFKDWKKNQASSDCYPFKSDQITSDWTFIFGHTHKPFQDQIVVPNLQKPVKVFNTGGWTVDRPKMTPSIGASAVFISDKLNTVALRLYNQPINGAASKESNKVFVAGTGAKNDFFLEKMSKSLEKMSKSLGEMSIAVGKEPDSPGSAGWAGFSDEIDKAISLRVRIQQERNFPELTPVSRAAEMPSRHDNSLGSVDSVTKSIEDTAVAKEV